MATSGENSIYCEEDTVEWWLNIARFIQFYFVKMNLWKGWIGFIHFIKQRVNTLKKKKLKYVQLFEEANQLSFYNKIFIQKNSCSQLNSIREGPSNTNHTNEYFNWDFSMIPSTVFLCNEVKFNYFLHFYKF